MSEKNTRTRRILTALMALWFVLAGIGTAFAQTDENDTFTWSVRPTPTEELPERANFSYDMPQGAIISDGIRVRNFGAEVLPLAIYATDALTTPSGNLDLLPAGEDPVGVGLWITLEPPNVIAPGQGLLLVPAQGYVDVPFTITVPEGVESGDHVGGIVTSYLSETNDPDNPIAFDHRLAIRVQVRVEGQLEPVLEVSQVEAAHQGQLNPFAPGTMLVEYTVTNTGNVRVTADQLVRTRGLFGITGQEAELQPMPELLPGDSLRFSTEVPGVWPTFRTTAEVEVTPTAAREGDVIDVEPATAGATVWSVPWSQLLLAVLVLIPLLLWQLGRRRAARREEERKEQTAQMAAVVQEAVDAALAARALAPEDRTKHAETEPDDD